MYSTSGCWVQNAGTRGRILLAISAVLGLCIFVGGLRSQDSQPPPQPSSADQAKKVYDEAKTAAQEAKRKALDEAEKTFSQAMASAKKEYLAKLNVAFKAAMAAENLAEANRIDALRKSAVLGAATVPEVRDIKKEALDYHQLILDSAKRLTASGEKAGRALGDSINKATVTEEFRKNMQELRGTLASIRTEMKTWTVPKSKSAANLQEGVEKFLKSQDKDIEFIEEMAKVLDDKGIPPNDKKSKVLKMLDQLEDMDKGPAAELQALQRAFAAEHNITLNKSN